MALQQPLQPPRAQRQQQLKLTSPNPVRAPFAVVLSAPVLSAALTLTFDMIAFRTRRWQWRWRYRIRRNAIPIQYFSAGGRRNQTAVANQ